MMPVAAGRRSGRLWLAVLCATGLGLLLPQASAAFWQAPTDLSVPDQNAYGLGVQVVADPTTDRVSALWVGNGSDTSTLVPGTTGWAPWTGLSNGTFGASLAMGAGGDTSFVFMLGTGSSGCDSTVQDRVRAAGSDTWQPIEFVSNPSGLGCGWAGVTEATAAVDGSGNTVFAWAATTIPCKCDAGPAEQRLWVRTRHANGTFDPATQIGVTETNNEPAYSDLHIVSDAAGHITLTYGTGPPSVPVPYTLNAVERSTAGVWGTPQAIEANPNGDKLSQRDQLVTDASGRATVLDIQSVGAPPDHWKVVSRTLEGDLSTWGTTQNVYSGALEEQVGGVSLAIDADGNLMSAWSETQPGSVAYATRAATHSAWSAPASIGTGIGVPKLAMNAAGDAVVAYWSAPLIPVASVRPHGGSWDTPTSLDPAQSAYPADVTIDSHGAATAAWVRSTSDGYHVIAAHTLTVGSRAAPDVTGTSPTSPASSLNPTIQGSAQAGSTVSLYTNASCTGTPTAAGSAASFASPGIPVTVATASTTSFWATATDLASNTSSCSSTHATYTHVSAGGLPPAVNTYNSSSQGGTYVNFRGGVNPNGQLTTYSWQYGATSGYGHTTPDRSDLPTPPDATEHIVTSDDVGDLTPGTQYHFRIKAANASGTTFGDDHVVSTSPAAITTSEPVVHTYDSSSQGGTYVNFRGGVNPGNQHTVYSWQYGPTAGYGQTTPDTSDQLPSVPDATEHIVTSDDVGGLTPGTQYHFRIKATNVSGTAFGDDHVVRTSPPAIVDTRSDAGSAAKTVKTYRVLSTGGVDVKVGATAPDQTTVQLSALISGNGSSLISDNGSSLISDNGSSVTFNNLISDNGSSLISDNGSSLTVPVIAQGDTFFSKVGGLFSGIGNWLLQPLRGSADRNRWPMAQAAAASKRRRVRFVLLAAGTHTFRRAGQATVNAKLGRSDRNLLTRLMRQAKTLHKHHRRVAHLTIFLTYVVTQPGSFRITPQVVRKVVAVTLKP